ENLENYINDFSGTCIIVSHDRAFLDHTCDYLFVIKDAKIIQFAGNYTNYSESELFSTNIKKISKEKPQLIKKKKKGLSFNEKKELDKLPNKIECIESEIASLEESFNTVEKTELGTLEQRTNRYNLKKEELELLENRWLELLEKEEC
ncbi:MAG: ABC transporter ATP-binding protein, partial [Sphaerochaetaceae bacterium]|nr:ABC transporter ATP-binding protein [Sphaerochaetaceae bacterium]